MMIFKLTRIFEIYINLPYIIKNLKFNAVNKKINRKIEYSTIAKFKKRKNIPEIYIQEFLEKAHDHIHVYTVCP